MPLDRFAARLKKRLEKKLHDWKQFWLHLCKLETCTYISLAAMYGLTAIDKILVAGWKHASFLCYSMGARWFLRFLGPKLELPRSSAYSPYLRRLWHKHTHVHVRVHNYPPPPPCTNPHPLSPLPPAGRRVTMRSAFSEERKWRRWTDDVLMHVISPNIYRSVGEARQAVACFAKTGEWKKHFSGSEYWLVVLVGPYAMYILGRSLKKRWQSSAALHHAHSPYNMPWQGWRWNLTSTSDVEWALHRIQ